MVDNNYEIIKKNSDAMYRCAYTYCNNRQDAEDIVQEAFYKYFAKKPKFNDDEHEKAWLLRVTINTAKNYVHSFWRKNVELIQDDIPQITKEEQGIWEMVKELPEKYRIVIQLYYMEGYSIMEIAGILNKKDSTIGTRFERAKKKLKEMIEKEGGI